MLNEWHMREVFRSLYYGVRRHARRLLRMPAKATAPIVDKDLPIVAGKHLQVCKKLEKWLPENSPIKGSVVAEIGPGHCLAPAALMLGKGASCCYLIEPNPPAVFDAQEEIFNRISSKGIPLFKDVLLNYTRPLSLNTKYIKYHRNFMNDVLFAGTFDFIYSHNVLEHVENLQEFFEKCMQSLKRGGAMLHFVDLTGHGFFEDPIPPLDFHVYPDWLFYLMCPPHNRATRRFAGEYRRVVEDCGFENIKLIPIAVADEPYLDRLMPRIRKNAKKIARSELSILEFVLLCKRSL
ncbi:methyltransferase domain-containing protein [Verrucomicrobiota bacterium]